MATIKRTVKLSGTNFLWLIHWSGCDRFPPSTLIYCSVNNNKTLFRVALTTCNPSCLRATQVEEGVYKNVDGHRFDDGRYKAFMQEISEFIPSARQFTDPIRTFAYGTDASFYRLNPKLVVKVHTEEEIRR